MQNRFTVIESVEMKVEDGDNLCLQKVVCPAQYGTQKLYRFIRKSKEGKLKPQRGGAIIFNLNEIAELMSRMEYGEIPVAKASRTPPPFKIRKAKK